MKTIEELKNEKDKLSIFMDYDKLLQYVVKVKDLMDAFTICLSDEEKLEVIMKSNYFSRFKLDVKTGIIMLIKEDSIKSQIIQNTELLESVFDEYSFMNFLLTVNDESKMYILNNSEILKKFNIGEYDIKKLIETMSNDIRIQILSNKDMIKKLGISGYYLKELIIGLESDEIKSNLAEYHEFNGYDMANIIKTFSDENKKKIIIEDKIKIYKWNLIEIIANFEINFLIDFINGEQEFLAKKDIKIFEVIKEVTTEKQLQLLEKFDELQIEESEKKKIIVSLSYETKKDMDIEKIDEKYRRLIDIETSISGIIIPDLESDLSQYEDLDELLSINPLKIVETEEQRQQLLRLCKICPDASILDNLIIGESTGEEYVKGEEWVSSILQGIQSEWTDIQKLAYIDTMIGKKISYSPEFGTEAEKSGDARALWKIITSGYGVCNGIAQVEQYLLSRVGIEAELVLSPTHSYVKVKNIKVPTEQGIVEGDTLVDPTWNLTASRYGSRPHHFCKSYEEIRKVDIDEKGKDHECHQNSELEQSETINMDIKSLREVYKSIGIVDKDGNFPILQLILQSEQIDKTSTNMLSNINSKFALLKKWCPEFATCQNSTIDVLKDILFENNEYFKFNRCITSRVYDRKDPEKQAVLYVYMELEEIGKIFFYADKENSQFIQMSQEEFEKKFECYQTDLEKLGNKRYWETEVEIEEKKENSSGEIVAEEGR